MTRIQQALDSTPGWLHWVTIAGSLVLSVLQPLAALAALVLACLQIYSWVQKHRRRGPFDRRKQGR